MPVSSLRSKDEEGEESCEYAESGVVWIGLAAAAATAEGCGLRSPPRPSNGTGVIDAGDTSADLPWGFIWFLLQQRKIENDQQSSIKMIMIYTGSQCFLVNRVGEEAMGC